LPSRWALKSSAAVPISIEVLSDQSAVSVLLSLGSNIEPAYHLPAACRLLAERLGVVGASQVFETAPVGVGEPFLFLNAAIEVHADMTPRELKFEVLRPLERRLGRIRTADRNAPRTIDVDISLFGQRILRDTEAGIEIPDPEILTSAHVAIPLADLAPERIHPVTGQRLREIAGELDGRTIRSRPDLILWPLEGEGQ
jgi:2-amino-4-hydroxy-6-hydroxymethyldihydropteridine diphosphokinase